MKLIVGFTLGVLLTVFLGMLTTYAYFGRGMAPVATSAPPMPFEKTLARMALHARMEREMPKQVPIAADESNLLAGAHIYQEHCAVCHGFPGQKQTAIALGEFPKPPHLFKGKGVTDDAPSETYWRVSNGIRLTGMPGFENSLSADQMWQVSLLLANAKNLPASVSVVLANPAGSTESSVSPATSSQVRTR
jgi:mono/diheme cytochrome c family protein